MGKKTLLYLGALAALYFLTRKKVVMVPSPGPGIQSLPTDSMAAATMPAAVQGMITDGARQAQTNAMQGFYY